MFLALWIVGYFRPPLGRSLGGQIHIGRIELVLRGAVSLTERWQFSTTPWQRGIPHWKNRGSPARRCVLVSALAAFDRSLRKDILSTDQQDVQRPLLSMKSSKIKYVEHVNAGAHRYQNSFSYQPLYTLELVTRLMHAPSASKVPEPL
jgi:hypothetical protein